MEIKKKYIYKDIILKKNRQYNMPVYQRTYTWENKNCKQLYDDIKSCIDNNSTHYLGSLVYSHESEKHKGSNFYKYQIIDGQQRLATLILLLKAILDIVPEKDNETRKKLENAIYNKNYDDEYKLKLQSIDDDNKEFKKILNNNMNNLNELSNVTKNYRYFKELLKTEQKYNYKEILSGIEKLIVAEIALEKKDRPQVIFESINSTGIELKDSEKIRNFLLMGISNKGAQKTYFDKYWVSLTDIIGNDNIENFFFDYLVMKKGSYFNKEELYDYFKKHYYSINNIKQIGKDILRYADYYRLIICNNSNLYSNITNKKLAVFKKIRHNTIYPFLMKICDDYSDIQKLYKTDVDLTKIEKKELKKRENEFNLIIDLLENYAIRRNVCEIPSSSLRRFYASLYNTIFEKKEYKNNYLTAIKTYLCTTVKNDAFPKDDTFIEKLANINFYRRSSVLKVIFNYIENSGNEEINLEDLTIEHIFPQTPDIEWKIDLGKDFDETKKYLNTLGNLSITGYNGQLLNKSFKEKREILLKLYQDGDLKIKTINEELLNKKIQKWNANAIKKRASRLSDYILKKYSYPKGIDNSLKFNNYIEEYYDNKEEQFMIDHDCPLLGIRIKGEDLKADTYMEAYWELLKKLYKINSKLLKQLAKNNWKITSSDRIFISTDKSLLSNPLKMETNNNDNIYIDKTTSRDLILNIMVSLIKEYKDELSIDDFCLLYDNERY